MEWCYCLWCIQSDLCLYDVFSPICAWQTHHYEDSAGVFHSSFIAWLFRSRFHLKPCRSIYPVEPCGFGVEVSLIWLCATLLLNIHSVISICLPLFPCKMQWVWHWTVAKAFTLNRILLNTSRKQWGEGSGFLLSFSLLRNKKISYYQTFIGLFTRSKTTLSFLKLFTRSQVGFLKFFARFFSVQRFL